VEVGAQDGEGKVIGSGHGGMRGAWRKRKKRQTRRKGRVGGGMEEGEEAVEKRRMCG
jgi:hypothetical protein